MSLKISRSRATAIEAVLALQPEASDSAKRLLTALQSVKKAKINPSWTIVTSPEEAAHWRKHPLIKRMKASVLAPRGPQGDWPSFHQAALASQAKWLLLLPKDGILNSQQIKELTKNLAGNDWIFSCRAKLPSALEIWLTWILGSPAVDLGAASMVRRDCLRDLAARYSAYEPLLGLRLYSSAISSGLNAAEIPPSRSKTGLSLWQALGLDSRKISQAIERRFNGAAVSAGLAVVGSLLYSSMPAIGLSMLSVGLLSLASFLGKPE